MRDNASGWARRAPGQLTKMVNQICIAGIVQGLSEGLSFARAAGLDPTAVVEVISKGAAQSWQMENRHKTMLAGHFDHGFAVEWMRKDLAICLDEARRNGASSAAHRTGRPVLCRSRENGRQALGYVQPFCAHRGLARQPPKLRSGADQPFSLSERNWNSRMSSWSSWRRLVQ